MLGNCNCKNILHLWKRDLGVESLARNVMTGSKAPSVPSGPRASSLSSYPSERASSPFRPSSLSCSLLHVLHEREGLASARQKVHLASKEL